MRRKPATVSSDRRSGRTTVGGQVGYNQNTGTNGWFTKDDWRKQVCVSQKRRKLAEASENVTCAERGVTGRLWTAGDGTG